MCLLTCSIDSRCYKREKGFVLVMVMLLMTILSLSAFVAIEQSQLSYKTNNGRVAQTRARQNSDSARLNSLNQLETLLKNTSVNLEQNAATKSLGKLKTSGFSLLASQNLNHGKAEVYYKALPIQVLKNGASMSQAMAYSGLGAGLGSHGTFSTHYELRAKGISSVKGQDVVFWTASDYRFIP